MNPAHRPPLSILVVDDSDAIRSRLCALLGESPRLQVVAAVGGGVEAMLAIARFRPAAVVLDIHLPGMSGLEVLRRIKSTMPQCVVVMLTSFHDGPFREISRGLGADAFFHKATEFESVPRFLDSLVVPPPTSPVPVFQR